MQSGFSFFQSVNALRFRLIFFCRDEEIDMLVQSTLFGFKQKRGSYSLRSDLTGFTAAAFTVRNPMVIAAIRPMINPARMNTPAPGLIR